MTDEDNGAGVLGQLVNDIEQVGDRRVVDPAVEPSQWWLVELRRREVPGRPCPVSGRDHREIDPVDVGVQPPSSLGRLTQTTWVQLAVDVGLTARLV